MEAFGTEWVQCAVAAGGVRWHETRWDFGRAILQGSQIGVTSLPEAMRELRLAKDRAASPRQNAAGASRTGLVTATQERQRHEQHENGQPTRSGRKSGPCLRIAPEVRGGEREEGFAALVDSANVAGWLDGTRKVSDHYAEQDRELRRRTAEVLEVLAVHQECESFATVLDTT